VVTANELRGAVSERVAACGDRAVIEIATKVVRKLGNRRVSLGRIRLQRLGEYCLEVPLQRAPQTIGRRPLRDDALSPLMRKAVAARGR